jgi:hypothetical protein
VLGVQRFLHRGLGGERRTADRALRDPGVIEAVAPAPGHSGRLRAGLAHIGQAVSVTPYRSSGIGSHHGYGGVHVNCAAMLVGMAAVATAFVLVGNRRVTRG